ncbi:MAG: pyridoxamine 5'-phosphate oxidase family protein [Myxococcales bacterium]|nr:pyridoxamine 5'-phosphate oxidase family protein [Myxococcales bacterium]
MGDTKNLVSQEAIAKIQHIAEGEIAMLCTFTPDHAMEARPMATQGIGADGTLWFFSSKDSNVNQQIIANPEVQLIYMVPGKFEYLTLDGTGSVSRDRAKIDELWSSIAKAWFPQGKDDPDLTLVTVTLSGGHYWDTKNGKMVSLAKIALAVVTGRPMDGGVEGSLHVRS